jgi:hypothetical protein
MRKVLISMAAAASAVALASPAAAQRYPQPQGYGYDNYGYNNNYGTVRALDMRISQLRNEIRQLRAQGALNRRDAAVLDREAQIMRQNLHYVASDRLTNREARIVSRDISRLHNTVRREVRAGPTRYGRYGY